MLGPWWGVGLISALSEMSPLNLDDAAPGCFRSQNPGRGCARHAFYLDFDHCRYSIPIVSRSGPLVPDLKG